MKRTPSDTSPWINHIRAALERREHAGNVQRMRVGVSIGLVIWVSFAAADFALAHARYHVSVAPVWWSRLGIMPLALAMLWYLRRKLPSPRALRALDLGVFGLVAASAGFNAAHLGGVESPYISGTTLVMLARAMCVLEPWPRALSANGAILLAHASALLATLWHDPLVASQLADSGLASVLCVQLGQLASAAGIISFGSHTAWALRRGVFEHGRMAHYSLLELLGEGGQGEVWKAFDRTHQRHVALKISRSTVGDTRALARFAREVDVLRQLEGEHVARVYDSGVTEEGLWFVAMELLEGADLAQLVSQQGPLRTLRVARLGSEVARALASSHAVGVLHRDVKPANVFVAGPETSRETTKLLDFGVAALRATSGEEAWTRSGAVIGTPAFMAPEVALGRRADERSDLYSLGATLYYALTGTPPTEAVTAPALAKAARYYVPESLAALVARCLAPAPEERPSSAHEVEKQLASLLEDAPIDDTRSIP